MPELLHKWEEKNPTTFIRLIKMYRVLPRSFFFLSTFCFSSPVFLLFSIFIRLSKARLTNSAWTNYYRLLYCLVLLLCKRTQTKYNHPLFQAPAELLYSFWNLSQLFVVVTYKCAVHTVYTWMQITDSRSVSVHFLLYFFEPSIFQAAAAYQVWQHTGCS